MISNLERDKKIIKDLNESEIISELKQLPVDEKLQRLLNHFKKRKNSTFFPFWNVEIFKEFIQGDVNEDSN